MTTRMWSVRAAVPALAALSLAAGGGESESMTPPPLDELFVDNYGDGVSYQAFSRVPPPPPR